MRTQNLKPIQSTEEARARGRAGGIKSGEVRREKKIMSLIYADVIAKKYDAKGKTLEDVINEILDRGDSASVSMCREMREATEGNKNKNFNFSGNVSLDDIDELKNISDEQLVTLIERYRE